MSKPLPIPFSTTLFVRDTCLCLHVQRAARALARRFDEALRPLEITNGQFSLMMSLNRPDPPSMSAVAAVLAMDRTTLTAALKPLERRGIVESFADPGDRRLKRVRLTREGGRLLAEALPIWKATHEALDERLGEGGAERLRADLIALT
ncbi:MarR family winged helix-turn-helix transcriptional regulator [Sinorhizobium meliloti]|uniref:MarR family winged helix-turn-helix transcriptional regulator n=1 Tax=Rhizobium meliloti TaxID=382 RepID=UPI000D1FB6AA|nr:MarR family transcriptional regulator [Sinorhizobium meliloti]MDW9417398.1 MarR family transcriptional regulator [Sinorhizobium meliloti]MDW9479599.1 MarR family transcriptional regulator [Sinorhizobium meliloti]MDW9512874.1 MarR family transcriptional regulator [Sinorhizobium meliloti]MDW9637839.1 MarR family transcriptional regulator [Sinorhizobium meliloti]MDW9668364.1 MarR family transcriptional regulator [Sinorhizobium meliloti]